MPFVSINYSNNANAPVDKWVCTRTSTLGPYSSPQQIQLGTTQTTVVNVFLM